MCCNTSNESDGWPNRWWLSRAQVNMLFTRSALLHPWLRYSSPDTETSHVVRAQINILIGGFLVHFPGETTEAPDITPELNISLKLKSFIISTALPRGTVSF